MDLEPSSHALLLLIKGMLHILSYAKTPFKEESPNSKDGFKWFLEYYYLNVHKHKTRNQL